MQRYKASNYPIRARQQPSINSDKRQDRSTMIKLFTADTPNGHKISIMLEEAGIPYEYQAIDLGALEQKQDWFVDMNPNGRIPVIVDQANDNQTLSLIHI